MYVPPMGHATVGAVCVVLRSGKAHGVAPCTRSHCTMQLSAAMRCWHPDCAAQCVYHQQCKKDPGCGRVTWIGQAAPRSSVSVAASSLRAVAFRLEPLSLQTSAWDVAPGAGLSVRETWRRIDVMDNAVKVIWCCCSRFGGAARFGVTGPLSRCRSGDICVHSFGG